MFLDIVLFFSQPQKEKYALNCFYLFFFPLMKDFEMTWTLRHFTDIQYILAYMLANLLSQVYLSVNREVLHTANISYA